MKLISRVEIWLNVCAHNGMSVDKLLDDELDQLTSSLVGYFLVLGLGFRSKTLAQFQTGQGF
jgi:hypothetical protein